MIGAVLNKVFIIPANFKRICGLALFVVLFAGKLSLGQSKPPLEYQVKAAFIFNFTRFINWPGPAFKSADAPFVIGIAGNDPFGSYLDAIVEGEAVEGHRIVVERYHDAKDIPDCHLLYINVPDPVKIKDILLAVNHKNVLTVSDFEGFTSMGGDVRFFKDENKVKMEINMAAAKTSQLDISSKLLRVAKVN